MVLGVSQVKLFYFTLFGRKQLQTAPEAGREALPNEALIVSVFTPEGACVQRGISLYLCIPIIKE